MTEKKQDNTWKYMVISILTLLSVYFVISIRSNTNTYRSEIKSLEHIRDSLKNELKNRINPDSVLYYLEAQKTFDEAFEQLSQKFDSLKKKYHDKRIITYTFDVDSNIIILTNFLSEKNRNK